MKIKKFVNIHKESLFGFFQEFSLYQYVTTAFQPKNKSIFNLSKNNKYSNLNSIFEHNITLYGLQMVPYLDEDTFIIFTGYRNYINLKDNKIDFNALYLNKFESKDQPKNIKQQFINCHFNSLFEDKTKRYSNLLLFLFFHCLNEYSFEEYFNSNSNLYTGLYFGMNFNNYKDIIIYPLEKFFNTYILFKNKYLDLNNQFFSKIDGGRFFAHLLERYLSYQIFKKEKTINILDSNQILLSPNHL